jgi:hypothetical protein
MAYQGRVRLKGEVWLIIGKKNPRGWSEVRFG